MDDIVAVDVNDEDSGDEKKDEDNDTVIGKEDRDNVEEDNVI